MAGLTATAVRMYIEDQIVQGERIINLKRAICYHIILSNPFFAACKGPNLEQLKGVVQV
jgi:hypothetical protein